MGPITIGQVSGIIALVVFILQILVPLCIVILIASVLHRENNAVTWSVVSRTIQSSLWPSILRTDSASVRGVDRNAFYLTWLVHISLGLLGIAGIITPLGLYQSLELDSPRKVNFQIVKDDTAFGLGTLERYDKFTRLCGYIETENCPGRDDGYGAVWNDSGVFPIQTRPNGYINTTIPENITSVFSSATSDDGNTLSGPFDIQYRTWSIRHDTQNSRIDRGEPYSVGRFRKLSSLILENKTVPIGGLVVDMENGGVGFRDHTAPVDSSLGAEWTEDLTWVEPVTSCVDTNMTFSFRTGSSEEEISSISLVDNGGFVNLDSTTERPPYLGDTPQDPQLSRRAFSSATRSNFLAMLYYGVVKRGSDAPPDSFKGKEFPLKEEESILGEKYHPSVTGLSLAQISGFFLNFGANATGRNGVIPFNYTSLHTICNGAAGGDYSNITNIHIKCGYIITPPTRSDGLKDAIFSPSSSYSQKLYVCASAIQASVKTVRFSMNGTSSLTNLRIVSKEDKKYPDESSWPLWAMEKSGLNVSQIRPIWGIVADRYKDSPSLWTAKAPKYWLPAILRTTTLDLATDSLASTQVFGAALLDLYSNNSQMDYEYSGKNSLALHRLWQTYSENASTAGKMIDLIFVDIVANVLLGTKSSLQRQSNQGQNPGVTSHNVRALVQTSVMRIKYNFMYGIPAFLVLFVSLCIFAAALLAWATHKFSIENLTQLLNQTAPGRAVANLLYPELCHPKASTSDWLHTAGTSRMTLPVAPGNPTEYVDHSNDQGAKR